jgi:hypothetical protein
MPPWLRANAAERRKTAGEKIFSGALTGRLTCVAILLNFLYLGRQS